MQLKFTINLQYVLEFTILSGARTPISRSTRKYLTSIEFLPFHQQAALPGVAPWPEPPLRRLLRLGSRCPWQPRPWLRLMELWRLRGTRSDREVATCKASCSLRSFGINFSTCAHGIGTRGDHRWLLALSSGHVWHSCHGSLARRFGREYGSSINLFIGGVRGVTYSPGAPNSVASARWPPLWVVCGGRIEKPTAAGQPPVGLPGERVHPPVRDHVRRRRPGCLARSTCPTAS